MVGDSLAIQLFKYVYDDCLCEKFQQWLAAKEVMEYPGPILFWQFKKDVKEQYHTVVHDGD